MQYYEGYGLAREYIPKPKDVPCGLFTLASIAFFFCRPSYGDRAPLKKKKHYATGLNLIGTSVP